MHQGKPNAFDISLISCFENLNFASGEITPLVAEQYRIKIF